MKHRFNIYLDFIRPLLCKIVGKRYGCCNRLRNCTKCCRDNGYDDWKRREENGK